MNKVGEFRQGADNLYEAVYSAKEGVLVLHLQHHHRLRIYGNELPKTPSKLRTKPARWTPTCSDAYLYQAAEAGRA